MRTTDLQDTVNRLRIVIAGLAGWTPAVFMLFEWPLVPSLLVIAALTTLSTIGWEWFTLRTAGALIALQSTGGRVDPAHSRMQALEAQGRHAEAADAWLAHIAAHPDDVEARFHLADLQFRHLADAAASERTLRELRRLATPPVTQRRVDNALIDLLEQLKDHARLRVELARFADRWKDHPEAEGARRRLRELRAEPGP
ncbi:MAG: tetratricopeptide repeat protein [Gemmatimonadales bacterium]|nr:tetratricopeptide repeat protein [Gemmatimonadales bacterium]